jgi:hypothetical protein
MERVIGLGTSPASASGACATSGSGINAEGSHARWAYSIVSASRTSGRPYRVVQYEYS